MHCILSINPNFYSVKSFVAYVVNIEKLKTAPNPNKKYTNWIKRWRNWALRRLHQQWPLRVSGMSFEVCMNQRLVVDGRTLRSMGARSANSNTHSHRRQQQQSYHCLVNVSFIAKQLVLCIVHSIQFSARAFLNPISRFSFGILHSYSCMHTWCCTLWGRTLCAPAFGCVRGLQCSKGVFVCGRMRSVFIAGRAIATGSRTSSINSAT